VQAEVDVRDLEPGELAAAGGVAGRALADNPTFRWVSGDPALPRVTAALDVFVPFVEAMTTPQLGALVGRHVVGVCAAAPPGTCVGVLAPPEWHEPPAEIGPPGHESRTLMIWSLFASHDLDERHWHVGPVSVEPGLQGTGIGRALLSAFGARMDDVGEVAWLETDKPENVAFYRRHGFEVVEEVELPEHAAGRLTTWFMRRDPRSPDRTGGRTGV
jgi:ribosomal protein S18 acetylase RimI-like enzyme